MIINVLAYNAQDGLNILYCGSQREYFYLEKQTIYLSLLIGYAILYYSVAKKNDIRVTLSRTFSSYTKTHYEQLKTRQCLH